MIFFDYVYYRVHSTYLNRWKDDMPGLYGICALSVLQSFNLLVVGLIVSRPQVEKFTAIESNIALVVGMIMVFNSLRYLRFISFEELRDKFGEPDSKKGIYVVIYMVLSIIGGLFLFIYYP